MLIPRVSNIIRSSIIIMLLLLKTILIFFLLFLGQKLKKIGENLSNLALVTESTSFCQKNKDQFSQRWQLFRETTSNYFQANSCKKCHILWKKTQKKTWKSSTWYMWDDKNNVKLICIICISVHINFFMYPSQLLDRTILKSAMM